jgi:signal transduction histidine kinase
MASITAYVRRVAEWARARSPLSVDVAIAIGCFLTMAVWIVADNRAVIADRLEWWIFGAAALNSLPLLWRRHYPLLITALTGVVTTWLAVVNALGEFPAAQLVATYTFAALSPPIKRLVAVLGTAIGVTVSIVVAHEELLSFGPAGIMFAVAYALGTSARARRTRIAMLEERARRLAEEQAATATRERERIAREMHDILAHSMSLVVVQAEAGPVAVRTDPDKAEEVFDTISATAREALAQLRRALGVLRADRPGEAGEATRAPQPGLDALPPLVAGVRHAGLAATLEEHGDRRAVPPDLAATAYRIVQESLTNTVKHGRASQVRVRLDWRERVLRLEVRDDGRGPVGNGGPGGRGLVGMRERVAAAGGELSTGPGEDGTGFRVSASLPLP